MNESDQKRIERIDHTFELLLVLTGILTTALYESPRGEPSDLPLLFQSLPSTLNFLFLPFIILLPLWIYLQTTNSRRIQVFLRTYLWSLITFHLLILLMVFAGVSNIASEYFPVFGIILWLGLMFPALPAFTVSYIISSYGGALPRPRFAGFARPKFATIANILCFISAWATIWAILEIAVLNAY